MFNLLKKCIFFVASAIMLSMFLHVGAHAIPFGHYQVHSHPDGAKAEPYYCLRLDGLIGGSGNWTFDCDHSQSDVDLWYDADGIHITGSVYGGKDGGSAYVAGTDGLWDLDMWFTVGLLPGPSAGDTIVDAHHDNFGTISQLYNDGLEFVLRDHGKGDLTNGGASLVLGSPWRDVTDIPSGRGWLDWRLSDATDWPSSTNYPSDSGCCSDFLFTLWKVPEPGTLAIFGVSLVGLAFLRRRRVI